jgi:hypothetical protein
MKDTTYREAVFKDLTGRSVWELWNIYRGVTDSDSDKEESKGLPKFKISIDDLDHEGVDIFLSAVQPKVALREAAIACLKQLYTPETAPTQLVFDHHLIPDVQIMIITFKVLSKFRSSCDRRKVLHTLVATKNRRKFISLLIISRSRPSVLVMRSWAS